MTTDPPAGVARRLRRTLADPAAVPDGRLLDHFARQADQEAFAALVRRHGPMVLGVCRRVLGNAADADDAFQAAFLVLARKAGELSARPAVGNFLYGVAVHVALKAKAMAAKRRRHELASGGVHPRRPPEADDPDWRPAFDRELAALPDKYREPLVLHELEGLPRKVVAARLGLPDGTLSSRLATAKRLLAARLTRAGLPAAAVALVGESGRAAVPPALADAAIRSAGGGAGTLVRELAREVSVMILVSKLKAAGAVALALIAFAACGVALLPESNARPPVRPAARTAPPPKPPPEPAWKTDFRKAYGLKPGEVLKRVGPPFPACREEYVKGGWDGKRPLADVPHTRSTFTLRWAKNRPEEMQRTISGDDAFALDGRELGDILYILVGLARYEVEGHDELLKTKVVGDFIVNRDAKTEARVARMNEILRDECGLPVKLTLAEAERPVVVVGGEYKSRSEPGREKDTVVVYADPAVESREVSFTAPFAGFLAGLADHVRTRVVNDVRSPPPGDVTWVLRYRNHVVQINGARNDAVDHDPEAVTPVVAAQTGLTFKTVKRKVPVLFVEKGDAKK